LIRATLLSHFLLLFLLIRKLGREHELTKLKLLLPLQEECSASACGLDTGVIGLAERVNPITQHSICATELIAIQTPFGSYTPSFRAQFFSSTPLAKKGIQDLSFQKSPLR
jgi:hypothetical protein